MLNRIALMRFSMIFLFLLYSFKAFPFGPPVWADPYVKSYCPQSNKVVSKKDKWISIYSEVEFSISPEGYLVRTKRALLENISTTDETFNGLIVFDPSLEEIKEVELKIQSKYRWKKIRIDDTGGQINNSHKGSVIFVSGEPIPPRNKVVWEYSIIDKLELLTWNYEYIFDAFPILEKRIFISTETESMGYALELVDNFSTAPLDNITKISDLSYLIKNIPSIDKIPFAETFPLCSFCVYPYFVFFKKGTEKEIESFASNYIKKWELSLTEDSKRSISELALSLTQSKLTLKEKVEAITDFVQFHISYDSGFEKGEFGFIPLSPLEVIRSKRGDCKGKVLLAQKLLDSIGVKSEIVLLRYLNIYCPTDLKEISQAHFNHVVLAVNFKSPEKYGAELVTGPGNGLIIYDPTSKTTRFGESPPGLEGMIGFMPNKPSLGFFEIHLKKPSVWLCQANVEVDYDQERNMYLKINIIDNGLSSFISLLKEQRDKEDIKKELIKLYSKLFPTIRIVNVNVNEPPSVNIFEVVIEMKVEKPYYELQKSIFYINPLAALFVGFSFFTEEQENIFNKEDFPLFAPWNRQLNANGCEETLLINLSIKFTNFALFDLPNNFSLQSNWVNGFVNWSKESSLSYKASAKISLPRGKWETEKIEEKRKDVAKIRGVITLPLKGI